MGKLDKKNIENITALTPMQEGMLFHYLAPPKNDIYFEQLSLDISGGIDMKEFEKAWNFVIETNEMLRTVFRWEKMKEPVQITQKIHHFKPRYYDLSGADVGKKENIIEKIKSKDKKKKFDLQQVPFRITLCKIEPDHHIMIISHHHILYDGWSSGIILKEFFNAYHDQTGNKKSGKPVKNTFKEFVTWLNNQDQKKQEKFWKHYLTGFEPAASLPLPVKRARAEETGTPGNLKIIFKKDTLDQLDRFTYNHKVTMAAVLYSTWGILLQKYNNTNDVIFGTTVSGRSPKIKGIEEMVGLFINTVPLRVLAHDRERTIDLLNRINQTLQTRDAYESNSLVKIKGYSQLHPHDELFDSIVVIENYPLSSSLTKGTGPLTVNSYSSFEMSHYDLTVSIFLSGEIEVNFMYNHDLFAEDVIRRLSSHFANILNHLMENPYQYLYELDILSWQEKEQLLYDFNDTEAAYPRNKTIHQLFAEQARLTPDHTALVSVERTRGLAPVRLNARSENSLRAKSQELRAITYKELNAHSNQLAHLLKGKGVEADSIVGIMIERSIEMVIGILGILTAGGAYLSIDPEYPQERIDFMIKDSNVGVLVTTPKLQVKIGAKKNTRQPGLSLQFILIHTAPGFAFDPSLSTLTSTCQVSPTNLAYIMYTSGSTGRPKGVMVMHRNVVRLVVNTNYIILTGETRILQTGAPVFDATTFEIWGTLLNGGLLVLVEKEVILDAFQLGKTIEKNKINTLWLTSPLFNQLAQENGEIFSNLDYLLVGGDVLSPRFINLVRSKSEKVKIINGYGPTENTTFSTTFLIDRDYEDNIPIGKPIGNSTAYILDNHGLLQPIGIFGELWVGGDGVSRGYLNSPELTAEKFDQDLWDCQDYRDKKNRNKGPEKKSYMSHRPRRSYIYKTGDNTRWLPDGNIEFSGRLDHQVKIHGFRIELEEIEHVLLAHPGLKAAVVMVREPEINTPAGKKDEPYLCAYVVPQPGITGSSSPDTFHLHRYLAGKLPGYMMPAYFVKLKHLPLTSNGKLDRKALPGPKLDLIHQYIPPGNNREERLVEIYSEILEIEKEKIGINANFFELGGHSLKAIRLINRIHKEFGIRLDLAGCLKTPTIQQISRYLESSAADDGITPIMPVEEKEYYPLSSAQKRLYTLQQLDRENIAYNIFCSRAFDEKITREKLEWAFRRLIHRHESLRTSFVIIDGQIVQRIHPQVPFALEPCQLPITHFIRPFDLSQAPLLRAGLVTHEDKKLTLLIDIHHIITDGVSQAVLVKELIGLCQEETLPSPRLRYKDFSRWQQQWKKEEYKWQEAFWLQEFQDNIPRLNMPIDFPRPEVQSFAGDILIFELNRHETARLKKMAREETVTSFMMLLTVYYVFLAAVSYQEDIVVGVPTVGRRYADLDNIIGMFVNTLVLRNFPKGEITFRKLVSSVKTRTLKAFENQDYQFADLVERLLSTRDPGRNPIFDVMFTFNDWKDETYDLNRENIFNKTARFDLILHAFEKNETFYFAFEYSTSLYKKETIQRFVVYFKKILSAVMENPDKNISGIEIINDEEKTRLICGIKNKDEKSAILMEQALRNKTKGQQQATNLTADFDI